ncbi:MAG: hypothetical protein L0287_10560 [Anaerolineae bacterium]|nr:hypothetical protein [Anaerolineae bacterium]MCI0608475.1 hypothetical protein [Anaerolineae bacterium]
MDIYLATEHAYHFIPQFNVEVARDRVEQKKVSLIAGTLGSLFSRAKPEDLQLTTVENRVEPFWLLEASSRTVYDRARTYTIPASGTEVRSVTVMGTDFPAVPQPKGEPAFTLTGVEHCVQELETRQTFDGITGAKADLLKYAGAAKTEIADITAFTPDGVLVIPPQVKANAVVRQVTAEVVQPVQNVQTIHEERVDIKTVDLNFRPIYAFEYEWAAKNKRVVIEFDPLTGEMRTGGKRWSDQIKSMVTRDLIFDITADAFGTIVPGGSIAVKLVKAVVDRKK